MTDHVAVKHVLSLDEVLAAQAGSNQKGMYEEKVKEFFASGSLAWDFTELFPEKDDSNLRNNVKKYAKEQKVPFQIIMQSNGDAEAKKHVLLVNMDVYRLQAQTANEQ